MKDTTAIRSLLGLSQEEIALLLGTTRTQWSMYEIGHRDLPLESKKQLASLLQHLQDRKEGSKESEEVLASEQLKSQQWLKQEWNNQQYKKLLLDKKIRIIENKRAESFASLEVASFLETQPMTPYIVSLLESIRRRASATLNKNPLHLLWEMQIKREHLEMAKSNLEQRMLQKP